MTSSRNTANAARVRMLVLLGVLGLSAVAVRWWLSSIAESPELELTAAEQEYSRGAFVAAERSAIPLLDEPDVGARAAFLAGRAAMSQDMPAKAVDYFDRVPDNDADVALAARCEGGDLLLLSLCEMSLAEQHFLRALEIDPDNVRALDRLGYLLGLSSRQWEQIPYRLRLIRLNQSSPLHLLVLGLGETALENSEEVERYLLTAPNDPLVQLAAARVAIEELRADEARDRLVEIVRQRPGLIEAQVRLGQLLLEGNDASGLVAWYRDLPVAADEHPAIWQVRGDHAALLEEQQVAARCYWEAVRLDPNRSSANYRLAQVLTRLGRGEEAAPFFARAEQIEEYVNAVKDAYSDPTERKLQGVVDLAERAGLMWEAIGWSQQSFNRSGAEWARGRLRSWSTLLSELPLERSVAEVNPAATTDLTGISLPDWTSLSLPPASESGTPDVISPINFQSVASEFGIDFQYFNGGNPSEGISRMYEFTGGGTGVLDYDCDGWPDLHLTQGSHWPPADDQRDHLDRLFRNREGRSFADVTNSARIVESGFSQGVAVGDFNNDGFPDLYIGNIGANRFLQNNGDGTFTDVTGTSGMAGDDWTTSCLFADLNADSLPDLYCVNYLTGDDIFERACQDESGARLCMPQTFDAAQDRVYLNRGDGSFADVTDESGIRISSGKGLGIIATDFDGSGRMSLFVANDSVPNFFFVSAAGTGPDATSPLPLNEQIRFSEVALASGLALNLDGRPEACMGVAAGDVDNDELLDLFITNFHLESNTLYRQSPAGLFVDGTRDAGLRDPTLNWLGFGTQFVDADLDGDLDVLIANGHINDYRSEGIAYQMRPQVFENLGTAKFREVPAADAGAYFDTELLGRSMARLDWNRDGRAEVVISHLDEPVALLRNATQSHGHWLAVELRGTKSSRDAIGATVIVTTGNQRSVARITAGDGYLASNERRIVFGLGDADRIDAVNVIWPSGLHETHTDVPVNSSCLIVEANGLLRCE